METGRRIDVLDGWRGISIVLVLMGHFFPTQICNLGAWGVEWFFVLSGRLMAEILFVRNSPLPEFFRRRVTRIMPVLVIYVIIAFLFFKHTQDSFKISAAITALTFTINYASVYIGHQAPIIAHIWSVCVEEHSYLVLGAIALISRRTSMSATPVIAILALASLSDMFISNMFPHRQFFDVTWRTDAHMYSILFGVLGRIYFHARRQNGATPAWLAPVALAAAIASQLAKVTPNHLVEDCLSTAFLSLAVNSVDVAWPVLRKCFEFTPLRHLGIMSFSIYMWQQALYYPSRYATADIRALALLAALTVGFASFHLLETPLRRALNRISLQPPGRLSFGYRS